MGEKIYTVVGQDAKDHQIMFSESDDRFQCLCTFPHNDDNKIWKERLKALALLGAAVRLIHSGQITNEAVYLPEALPAWIVEGIDKLGETEPEAEHGKDD